MGGSIYNDSSRLTRSVDRGYSTKSASELFSKKLHESLSPKNLRFRESRDSENHPNSLPIIIGLDVTGSMGKIPHDLLKSGLPTMMTTMINNGLPDSAVCFVAIGDHFYDSAPIQISQFESGDEELDTHLQNTWLEGGGGGNGGESYFLAWYFAAKKTVTDAWDKRKQKGFLFTIGDEHCHPSISSTAITNIFGDGAEGTIKSEDLLKEAQQKYHVFHINMSNDFDVQNSWKQLLGENNISVMDYRDIPLVIAKKVLQHYSSQNSEEVPHQDLPKEDNTVQENNEQKFMM